MKFWSRSPIEQKTAFYNATHTPRNIVFVKFSSIIPTDKHFDEYMAWAHLLLTIDYRYVLIMDITNVTMVKLDQQGQVGAFCKKHDKLLKKWCIAFVYVVPNNMVIPMEMPLLVLNGMFQSTPIPVQYFQCPSKREAMEKAQELISAEKN